MFMEISRICHNVRFSHVATSQLLHVFQLFVWVELTFYCPHNLEALNRTLQDIQWADSWREGIVRIVKNIPKPHPEWRAMVEHFWCCKTLTLLIKLKKKKKLIQIYVLFSVHARPIEKWEFCDKCKNGQSRGRAVRPIWKNIVWHPRKSIRTCHRHLLRTSLYMQL